MVSKFFKSYKSDDHDILQQIRDTYDDIGYLLDPHTATGVRASNSIVNSDESVITMGTAHPAKFAEAIERAIPEYNFNISDKVARLFEEEESFSVLSKDYLKIKDFILSKAL